MRTAFVIIPNFEFVAHQREGGALHGVDEVLKKRAVLVEGEGGRARVMAVSPGLRRMGVQTGMTVASARSRDSIWVAQYDGARVAREASQVAGLLLATSPRVNVVQGGSFWVGADGCRLLGGERVLVMLCDELIRSSGHERPRIGVADTVIAARASAIHELGIIPTGSDASAMAPLPLSVLPLAKSDRETFWALGIRTVGAFSVLPSRHIMARFGVQVEAAHRMAQGEDTRSASILSKAESPSIEVDFETPFEVVDPALFVLQGGMERLMAPHRARGFGVRSLKIELTLIEGTWEREVRPADPVTNSQTMVDMCRAVLHDAELPSMMEGIRARIVEVAPAVAHQEGLWTGRRRQTVALNVTFVRLLSRLGPNTVGSPGPECDAHLPEQAAEWCSVDLSDRRSSGAGPLDVVAAWRTALRPASIALDLVEERPARARLNGSWVVLDPVIGPQRIETAWWDTHPTRPIRRDYWYVQLDDNSAMTLYRDLGTDEWFIQSVLD
jgi:protein ImuB